MTFPITFAGGGSDTLTHPFFVKRGLLKVKGQSFDDHVLLVQLQNEKGADVGPYVMANGNGMDTEEWAISADGTYTLHVVQGGASWTVTVETWRELCADVILSHQGTASDCDGSGARQVIGSVN